MTRIAAIDLGTYAVKVALWQILGRTSWQLVGRYQALVEAEQALSLGVGARLLALDALIQQEPALQEGNIQASLAWGGEWASLHHVTLPFSEPSQIKKTLPFAVESEVPFDLEAMVLGWRIASVQEGATVLVALAKQQALADVLGALAERNLDPHRVGVSGELLATYGHTQGETVAVLDIGHSRTEVVVVQGSRLVSARVLDVGGALLASYEPSPDQGSPEPGGSEPMPDKNPVLPLLAPLRAVLLAIEDSTQVGIDRVLVGGGGSLFPGVPEALQRDLGVPVQPVCDAHGDVVSPPWLVADALAADLMAKTGPRSIDLRVGKLAFKGYLHPITALLAYGGAAVVGLSLVVLVVFLWQNSSKNAELATIESEISAILSESLPGEKVRSTAKALALMQTKIDEADARAAILGTPGVPPMVDLLAELTQAFPPPTDVTVDVTQLTLTPRKVSFDATTDSYASADRIVESLREELHFHEAQKSNETKSRNTIRFSAQIPLTDDIPDDEEPL